MPEPKKNCIFHSAMTSLGNPDIADQASAGGKARAASLPKVRRVEIARRAAKARWGKKQKRKAAA